MRLPSDILELVPNLVHAHPKDNPAGSGCAGEQSAHEIALMALRAGFREAMLTYHVSDPAAPRPVRPTEQLATDLLRYMGEAGTIDAGLRVYAGVEASLLADIDGLPCGVDAPFEVLRAADIVIASIHGTVPKTAGEAEALLDAAIADPYVDVIGHPDRGLTDLAIDWPRIFSTGGAAGKLFELNVNTLWLRYGHIGLRLQGKYEEAERHRDWLDYTFLPAFGASGASAVVSVDLHNHGMLPTAAPTEAWHTTVWQLRDFFATVLNHVGDDNIVNGVLPEILENNRAHRTG